LVERIYYDLLFRWFVGVRIEDPVWGRATFPKKPRPAAGGRCGTAVFFAVLAQPKLNRLLSREQFSVGRYVVRGADKHEELPAERWIGRPAPGPGRVGGRDFHVERCRHDTRASTIDADARLLSQGTGKEARLVFMGHAWRENRNWLAVSVATRAAGHADRLAAVGADRTTCQRSGVALGTDKGAPPGVS
jgi:hypothetical protein